MKVFTILFIAGFGHTLAEHTIWKRASNDYPSENPAKPATQTESSDPTSPGGYNPVKYQSPPYVAPQRVQYTPQQLNYVVQPTYKYLQQATAPVSPAPYLHQQTQQQPQYTPQNVVYNPPQPVSKISAFPQKVYNPGSPTPAPYSLAGDVSSFKYTSPIVSYSNLGVIQQNLGKSSASSQQEPQTRPSYSQIQSQPPSAPQHNAVPQPIFTPQSQPQPQLIYRPKYQLPQISYNPAPQQHIPVPAPAPNPAPKYIFTQQSSAASLGQNQGAASAKFSYNQPGPVFASVTRPQQPAYQVGTQKLAAAAPSQQQILYAIPQQLGYSPVHSQQQDAQPVQPAHSVPQPIYVLAPQY